MLNPFKIFLRPRLNTPPNAPPPIPTGEKVSKTEEEKGIYLTQYSFNIQWQIMEERMNTTNIVLLVSFFALLICFATLFYGYWQFASTSFNDYSNKVDDLNDQRYLLMQQQIDFLSEIATPSAQ